MSDDAVPVEELMVDYVIALHGTEYDHDSLWNKRCQIVERCGHDHFDVLYQQTKQTLLTMGGIIWPPPHPAGSPYSIKN